MTAAGLGYLAALVFGAACVGVVLALVVVRVAKDRADRRRPAATESARAGPAGGPGVEQR